MKCGCNCGCEETKANWGIDGEVGPIETVCRLAIGVVCILLAVSLIFF